MECICKKREKYVGKCRCMYTCSVGMIVKFFKGLLKWGWVFGDMDVEVGSTYGKAEEMKIDRDVQNAMRNGAIRWR